MFSLKRLHKNHFETEYLKTDLKDRSVRGGIATVLGQVISFVIQIVSTTVLARLLVPDDFGLIAMVTAVTGFAVLFKDLGLSMATIQKTDITHEQISTLFWINLVFSCLVAVMLVMVAPVIAWFYGEPQLIHITFAFSLVFLLGGLTVQHQALLQRQMRFKALAVIQIISLTIGVTVAIFSAILGAGYWSLVIKQVISSFFITFGTWVFSGWRPGRPVRYAGVRRMLFFGGSLTCSGILNFMARNADKILIGKVKGSGPVGLYSKAYDLMMLPIMQINAPIIAVVIPTLSRLQDEPARYRKYYCKVVNLIAYATIPFVLGMAAVSEDLIHVLLGEKWLGASKIFMILAIAGVGQPVSNTLGAVLISSGQASRQMRWSLVASPIILASFILGLPWGSDWCSDFICNQL